MQYSAKQDQQPAEKEEEISGKRILRSLSGPLTFAIVIVAVIFVMSITFRVSNIVVVGNEHYTAEEIISAIDIEEGDNLFFFDRFGTISRVFAKLPYVEEVSVERALPNRVTVTVTECKAMAYLVLGDEEWTIDHSCKVLGKAAEGETANLIPVTGIRPGTLLIGEDLATEDEDEALVAQLAETLTQIQDRGLSSRISRVDFTDPESVSFYFDGRFTVKLGDGSNIEHKFGMFVAVLERLKDGDSGVINVSDGSTAHFSPV